MPKVTFLVDGRVLEAAVGSSFLDLCQANAAPHEFGCTVGSCGTCRLELPSGAGNVQAPDEDELDTLRMCTDHAGARLGCQLKIHGDISVRPVD